MTEALLSQIEQILRGIRTRAGHSHSCLACDAEIARTVERMFGEVTKYWLAFGRSGNIVDSWAAAVRAAGGTP